MAKRIITKIGDIFCAPFVRICYPNGLNISICNALNRQNKRKVFGITNPYIQNGRILEQSVQ